MTAATLPQQRQSQQPQQPQRQITSAPLMSSNWQWAAACSELNWSTPSDSPHNPETFFPKREAGGQCGPAKSICRGCPVREVCLVEGLRQPSGVWGGLSEKERREAYRMVREGVGVKEILAHFDAMPPRRRRMRASTDARVDYLGAQSHDTATLTPLGDPLSAYPLPNLSLT